MRVIRHKRVEGVCAYCGKALRFECVVRSSDGKEFTVGRDCVRKTGDFGLHGTIEAEFTRLEAEEQAALIAQTRILRGRPEVAAALKARPHPFPHLAKDGLTLDDWVEFATEHGGPAKQAEVAEAILKVAETLGMAPVNPATPE